MALILQTDSVFSDANLGYFYPDSSMSSSSIFVFDAMDEYSWTKQSNPIIGDSWLDLADGDPAIFPDSKVGFSDGFIFPDGEQARISLPSSSKIPSNNKSGFLVIVWFKFDQLGGLKGIAGVTGGNPPSAQWMFYVDNQNLVFAANRGAAPQYSGIQAGMVYQAALAYVGDGTGNFIRQSYLNGVLQGSGPQHASADIIQPSTGGFFGRITGLTQTPAKGYRILMDALSGEKSAAEIVENDFLSNVDRFI
jgi:hypothetical protein